MTPYRSFLGELYTVTKTPSELDYYSSEEYLASKTFRFLEDEFDDIGASVTGLTLSVGDVEASILFLVKSINTPTDFEGVFLVEPCIRDIVIKGCNEMKALPIHEQSLLSVLSSLYRKVENLRNIDGAEKNDKRYLLSRKPLAEQHPLFTFHRVAYESDAGLYAAYAYELHKKIRDNEILLAERFTTHGNFIRSARFFFKYAADVFKNKAAIFHPAIGSAAFKCYKDGFIEKYIEKSSHGTAEDIAKDYMRYFENLLSGQIPKSHTAQSEGGDDDDEEEEDDRDVRTPRPVSGEVKGIKEDPYNSIREYLVKDTPGEEKKAYEDYEPPEETSHYVVDGKKALTPKPSFGRNIIDFINLRSFHFSWDIEYLNLFHYAIIYNVLRSLWGKASPSRKAVIIYIYILMHTGLKPGSLLKLSRSIAGKPEKDKPVLYQIAGMYYLVHLSMVTLKKNTANSACLKTSTDVFVPLPVDVKVLLDQYFKEAKREHIKERHEYVFVEKIKDAENTYSKKRMTMKDIADFIDKEINSKYKDYKLNISLSAISRSFMPLYHHKFGLDPLICNYISGVDHYRQYRSQMHYIHIPHDLLQKKYIEAYDRVNRAIRNNRTACGDKGYFKVEETEKLFPQKKGSLIPLNVPGYGSTIICGEPYIVNIVSSLKELIDKSGVEEIIRRHNLFSIYTYLCLQFSTLMRPRNDPPVDLDVTTGNVLIQDKQSAQYHEERILQIPPVLSSLLKSLVDNKSKLIKYIAGFKDLAILKSKNDKLFFLINDKGNIVDLTLKGMWEILKSVGIEYDLPPNMPRHNGRNYLYHAGICNDAADIVMGHQHAGKEALNITSSGGAVKPICQPVIEKMLVKLGFEPVEYLPVELRG